MGPNTSIYLYVPTKSTERNHNHPNNTTQSYDRILVDAPCGSERHLIQQEEEAAAVAGEGGGSRWVGSFVGLFSVYYDEPISSLNSPNQNTTQPNRRREEAGLREWAPGRTKNIANDQRALLSSALRCVYLCL